ncbi:MAG: hypothetical protein HY927_09645 [Elusimicrobia bacterium]|nr:hypothetical protein [Elusimicrobiota bacterium]
MDTSGRGVRVFVKLGGSFVTEKAVAETLAGKRIVQAAKVIRTAIDEARAGRRSIAMVLAHGAGSFGHILAKRYDAVRGIHPQQGWEGFYKIRESMARMNLLFNQHCNQGGLFPVTVQPSAIAQTDDGNVVRLDIHNIRDLLRQGQIPLIHGDIVPDLKRGFTIASTEALLKALGQEMRFDRVVMVADTDGVLDDQGGTIPWIDSRSINQVLARLGGSKAPDVTGGMRKKVECLFNLVAAGKTTEARIIGGTSDLDNLRHSILGTGGGGTLIAA